MATARTTTMKWLFWKAFGHKRIYVIQVVPPDGFAYEGTGVEAAYALEAHAMIAKARVFQYYWDQFHLHVQVNVIPVELRW